MHEAYFPCLLNISHQWRRVVVLRLFENCSKAGVVRCLREYFEAQSGVRAVALQHLVEEFASALQWVLLLAEGGVSDLFERQRFCPGDRLEHLLLTRKIEVKASL